MSMIQIAFIFSHFVGLTFNCVIMPLFTPRPLNCTLKQISALFTTDALNEFWFILPCCMQLLLCYMIMKICVMLWHMSYLPLDQWRSQLCCVEMQRFHSPHLQMMSLYLQPLLTYSVSVLGRLWFSSAACRNKFVLLIELMCYTKTLLTLCNTWTYLSAIF